MLQGNNPDSAFRIAIFLAFKKSGNRTFYTIELLLRPLKLSDSYRFNPIKFLRLSDLLLARVGVPVAERAPLNENVLFIHVM